MKVKCRKQYAGDIIKIKQVNYVTLLKANNVYRKNSGNYEY